MAFPILGNPVPQFVNASGSPYADGTLSILDPADDTNKASYPTADDADAATNANDNPIELDARGAVPVGLFGLDDETYKIVLADSDGNNIFTVDDVRVPSREPHYAETPQTLTDAGAVSLTTPITHIVTTTASALTLADGTAGQRKFIVMITDAGDATLTPDNLGNGTSIVFADVGDSADLIFTNTGWHFIGGTAELTGSAYFATSAEIDAGTEADKPIAPDQLAASSEYGFSSGTFTPTYTGFSADPTIGGAYRIHGNKVTIWLTTTATGTSNATTFTIGLPSELATGGVQQGYITVVENGTTQLGLWEIQPGGPVAIQFAADPSDAASMGGFTASGTKGLANNTRQIISYDTSIPS